jgi:aryl-alcohol dehydrogenase-like predicted oxidoreductase
MAKLGKNGPAVSRLGLGCMGMSGMYGPTDDAESIRTIQAAIDAGVSLLDTGDFYGMGHNELLIGQAIAGRRDQVVLSVKFGALRGPDGSWGGIDTRPIAVKNFAAYSLKRLRVEVLDIYRPARLDPSVPIEDTIGSVADLVRAGYVKHIGLSEVGAETIRRAHATHPIADLQIEYSIASRSPEANIFPTLDELGIGATLYGVFSRGLLTGTKPTAGDFRGYLPRFSGERAAKNAELVRALQRFAQEHGMTTAQLAISWVLAKRPGFVPLVGVKTEAQLRDALGAFNRPLAETDVLALEALVPAGAFAGDRYGAEQMQHLDSER